MNMILHFSLLRWFIYAKSRRCNGSVFEFLILFRPIREWENWPLASKVHEGSDFRQVCDTAFSIQSFETSETLRINEKYDDFAFEMWFHSVLDYTWAIYCNWMIVSFESYMTRTKDGVDMFDESIFHQRIIFSCNLTDRSNDLFEWFTWNQLYIVFRWSIWLKNVINSISLGSQFLEYYSIVRDKKIWCTHENSSAFHEFDHYSVQIHLLVLAVLDLARTNPRGIEIWQNRQKMYIKIVIQLRLQPTSNF